MDTAFNYFTPEELMQKYPEVKSIGWTSSKLGIFANSGLLIALQHKREKKTLILESSFIELIEFYNSVVLKKQVFVIPKM